MIMIYAVKSILAVSAIVMTATGALADREELNSGFHGNTSYQASQNAAAAAAYAQAPVRFAQNRVSVRAAKARAAKAHAQASSRPNGLRSEQVFEWGKYQGQDPDANIRLMLRRDFHN
jgi:hypothetical protein